MGTRMCARRRYLSWTATVPMMISILFLLAAGDWMISSGRILQVSSFILVPRHHLSFQHQPKRLATSKPPLLRSFSTTDNNHKSKTSPFDSLEELRENAWIVLVDDEEPIRLAVSKLFALQGYQHITTCQDGQEVLVGIGFVVVGAGGSRGHGEYRYRTENLHGRESSGRT